MEYTILEDEGIIRVTLTTATTINKEFNDVEDAINFINRKMRKQN